MVEITLKNNKGFKWFSGTNTYVKGFMYDEQENYYSNEKLLTYFSKIKTEKDFTKLLNKANGIFSVIIKIKNKTLIAVDKTSFFSLFYQKINNKIAISDDPFYLISNTEVKINETNSEFFKASGYTFGSETLIENINVVKPAQIIIIEDTEIVYSNSFYDFTTNDFNKKTITELEEEMIINFEKSFSRMIKSLEGRQVALPLSGGYDSRLIATMLKKNGYNNVVCFTYGRKGNKEIPISKKVAENLGFKWIFIEYSDELIQDYFTSKKFREYIFHAGGITSMPYLQEYFAAKYLKENKLIDNNAIFLPGHSGDVLAGSQFIKVFNENIKHSKISKNFYKTKLFLNPISTKYKKHILNSIDKEIKPIDTKLIAYTIFEDLDMKEKFSKFIFRSSSVFTFFDYQVRFPFWDNDLMNFFKKLPPEYRKSKFLYDLVIKKHYFEKYNVNFKEELTVSELRVRMRKLKLFIKKFLPKKGNLKRLIKNDWISYYEITKPMMQELGLKYRNIRKFNSIITIWYLDQLKKFLQKQ